MSRRSPAPSTYNERLVQVHGLMDTLAEARLERVVRTARRLYGAQAAAILLWRGNRLAFAVQEGGLEVPADALLALGLAAVRDGAPRVLPEGDAAIGRRFAVVAPLAVDRGLSGGCLVLLEPRSRGFDPEDLQSLGDLASWGEHELDAVRLGQQMALRLA